MRAWILLLGMFWTWGGELPAQSLFEDATSGGSERTGVLDLGGYLRSTLYVGRAQAPEDGQIKSGYGEFSLKLKADKKGFGTAFADFRVREGQEFDAHVSDLNLREAYVEAYSGRFDFRVGHQVVVWGRADGMNPTDNITPKDMLVRSPDEDDRRLANFLIRAYFNAHPVRLEGIWIPMYRASRIPTEFFDFPDDVNFGGTEYPSARIENGSLGIKLNLELSALDGSLSYFNGHNPSPGLSPEIEVRNIDGLPFPQVRIDLKSYRMHVWGADFSTALGGWGIRGEAAYRKPHEEYRALGGHVIQPDLQYVLGVDREFPGDVSVIFQYIGRFVPGFEDLETPATLSPLPAEITFLYKIAWKNRLLASQQYAHSHSFSLRAAKSFWHETLDAELMGYVNLTSEEILIKPKLTYALTDALSLAVGGEWYQGPEETLFDLIDPYLSAFWGELRLSF
jgi:hypothetical protein